MFIGKLLQQAVKVNKILFIVGLIFINSMQSFAQTDNFRFKKLLADQPTTSMAFAVTNSGNLDALLSIKEISVKQVTKDWIYIQTNPTWIKQAMESKVIKSFYLEFSMPKPLNDSTLVTHFVKPVHQGLGGLQTPFTGKDVIVAFVDQGLDYNHPDFRDANGNTRVLYYWDHSLPNAANTPMPYGYGQLWTGAEIQAGTCGSIEESSGHGTSVTGAGVSNGLANGEETGMAPEANIIVIETNFNLPNWTLTVADACDFVFKKAEQLGMPAVVNLSVGSYLGSHDGTDPAAVLMDNLLDEKNGRIIVCAAGNSGSWGKYHVHGDVDSDTSFVWVKPNPASQLGPNTVYLDLWSDLGDATWSYAWGANKSSGDFQERATTIYRAANASIGTTIKDTLWNGSNRVAILEIYPEIVGPNLHLEFYFTQVDSTSYLYSFKTKGSGKYDAWSGSEVISLNNMLVTGLPTSAIYPPIQHYHLPDSLQTLVSSWNCSPKVVTVGNIRNRWGHVDANGNNYLPNPPNYTNIGQLTPASSKGPTKYGHTKPDVVACGDVSLSAGPFWILNDPGWNASKSQNGMHVRNGGTSMASPVVAGIAALYLEKCSKGNYQSFLDGIHSTAFTDIYTGVIPNNAYGYGKIHALNLLLQSNFTNTITADAFFCPGDSAVSTASIPNYSIEWMNGDTTYKVPLTASGEVYFKAFDQNGCVSFSDTLDVLAASAPPAPVISVNGTLLSTSPYPSLQWYKDGILIPGATNSSYTITLPSSSFYTVSRTSIDGCEVFSLPYNPSLGLEELISQIQVYPNPTHGNVIINSVIPLSDLQIIDLQGRMVKSSFDNTQEISISDLQNGTYYLIIHTDVQYFQVKIVKN
ncbi:S8 family peptidase [Fluviicola taffensis]|uniref:Peptidase S8 and S53 subtilisin kexin sedolisin n=1 Tax=Fluviicola taffensis (strain DSM 16823 / NCIMB 13979 / RW262) TaxID=755732 RepID=F2ID69_FLUTR|nr:S8 family peptidase [Fluviicola taffensis]AEA45484.1 peptidase S8 and S53 subtilisin kexin sedolisin [Fluviicola taffensis DSM 16823]